MGYLAHGHGWLVVTMICSLVAVAMSMLSIWVTIRSRKKTDAHRTQRR
jgi:amino acid permease